jgi:predicted alpha/beta-hydrolase family hydrolase
MTDFLSTGDPASSVRLLLAHGAGAPMTSPFMDLVAALLAERGLHILRFEFGYMAKRQKTGKRVPPPKAERLMSEFSAAIERAAMDLAPGQSLVIGGKSMGGRVASMVAGEAFAKQTVAGLVCLGYPFHPPSKPDVPRIAHLTELACPMLIVQGERDPFGSRSEVEGYVAAASLSPAIEVSWAADGDHDFGPRGGSGQTRKGNLTAAADAVAAFTTRLGAQRR